MAVEHHHWKDAAFWLLAVALALVLALAGPSERSVMGRLPTFAAQDLNRKTLTLPADLGAERTLALIAFNRSHAEALESWVNGLHLRDEPRIAWLRMAVLNDPGNASRRQDIETRLLARYTNDHDRARLVPVFTDRNAFVRAAGLASTEQPYAVVVSRSGEVLARAEGWFNEDKALALRETLLADSL